MNTILKKISKAFSYLFHPLIMPSLGLIILFNSNSYISYLSFDAKKIIFLIVFISTFLLPILFIPFYLFQNIIKNIEMDNHKERIIPLATTSVVYFFSYFMLHRLAVPHIIENFIFSALLTLLVLLLINIKWKISAHMMGIGGLTGAVVAFSLLLGVNLYFFYLPIILISGLVASSRILLKMHNHKQIYFGWTIGFIITASTLLILM